MGEFRTVTYEVHNPKIKQNQSVRFAVLADVHGSEFGTDNCDLQAKIRENLPDAILVAGDMVVRKDVSTLENARKLLDVYKRQVSGSLGICGELYGCRWKNCD